MPESVFTQLISGTLPCYKIHETKHTFAFLAKESIHLGHTLVVPKVEVDYFVDVPEPYYSAVFRVAKVLAQGIHAVTGCKRVGTIIAGWDVPHFHYHLVPMFAYHDLDPRKAREYAATEMQNMQARLVAALRRASAR